MALPSTQRIIPGTSKTPVRFTEGPILLALFEEYSEHVQIYLHEYHEKIAKDAVIPKIISGLDCRELRMAYLLDCTAYDTMTLKSFLNTLRLHCFGPDWALNQAQKVKSMKQAGQPTNQWFVSVFAASRILAGLPEDIKDPELITFLVDAMDLGLRTALSTDAHNLSNKIKAGTAVEANSETFAKWHALVNKADQQLRQNDVHLLELVHAKIPSFSQLNDFQTNATSSSAYNASSAYTSIPPCPASTAAALPMFPPTFSNQNPNFLNAVATQ